MQNKALTKILVAEDEDDIRAIMRVSLETIGHFVVEYCISGEDALSKAAAFNPDLILLDMMMPGMDGTETLTELRKITTLVNTPIIFMTAKSQKNEITSYMEMGALDVIAKPFDPIALPEKLRQIWSRINYE